tara:strand:+ start:401 stop:808 length:408 start_codon:yes stop_codon:yes gene_type:complete
MLLKKNIKLGKIEFNLIIVILFFTFFITSSLKSEISLEGNFTNIKVLDKISSKNILIKLKNGEEFRHKDLLIKSMKCKNSEFDDNPEVTAYLQVSDLTNKKKDKVFVFNNWMFSSSPSIVPFDHPVYDIWLVSCY